MSGPVEGRATRRRHQATDLALVALGWAAIVASAAVLPVDDLRLGRAALFVHLICLPIGFGGAVMVNVYMVLWLSGRRCVGDVLSLTGVAHRLMAVGLGGLIASGIALDPDLHEPLVRAKLALILVLLLSTARMQQASGTLDAMPPDRMGGNVPWPIVWRVVGPAALSQVAWCAVIVLGFVLNMWRQQ